MIENPFPGMDPYLEQRWGDFRAALVVYCADTLQDRLPYDLRARMDERIFIDFARCEIQESYVRIIDTRADGRLVTVIEFLSVFDKTTGPGRKLYHEQQSAARDAGVNLVEVDLLRSGEPTTLASSQIPLQYRAPFHISVWRPSGPPGLECYPAPLRQPLPIIAIPLREGDQDVLLNLQELINLCYRRGRYDDIDYSAPLRPALEPDDQEWVGGVLRQAKSS